MRTFHTLRVLLTLMAALHAGCGGSGSPAPTPTVTTFTITGQVVNAVNVAPITGANVEILDGPNAGKAATTDSNGRYSIGGVSIAGFTMRARAEGFVDNTQAIRIFGDQAVNFGMTVVN